MGCCLSSTGETPNGRDLAVKPRPSLEEEAVKEVLSETPFPPKPQLPEKCPEIEIHELEEEKFKLALPKISEINFKPEKEEEGENGAAKEDGSEYSEVCSSVTESLSTAATNSTVAEKREDDVTSSSRDRREFVRVKQRVGRPSPARGPRKLQHAVGDGRPVTCKSPAPRSGPTESRPRSPARTQSAATRTARTTASQCAESVGKGHDSGVGQYRRSRSPATGRDGVIGRSPAKRVSGGGGGGDRLVESAARGAENEKDLRPSGKRKGAEQPNGDVLREITESVDNPTVSLECFIFL